jgi:hypothetical protein
MTTGTLRIIVEAAREAHESAIEAHGFEVPARLAYDFIRSLYYDLDDGRYEALPALMPNEFESAYYDALRPLEFVCP